MSTVSQGITPAFKIHPTESGMMQSFQTQFSKGECKDIWGARNAGEGLAGKQLQRRDTMKLTIVHGQPTNYLTYIKSHHTLLIQEVVIVRSFCMQP